MLELRLGSQVKAQQLSIDSTIKSFLKRLIFQTPKQQKQLKQLKQKNPKPLGYF